MGLLYGFGLCCFLLSIWAVLQLVIMGIFFKMEVLAFIEEAEPGHHNYEDYDDFMKQTKDNYKKVGKILSSFVDIVIQIILDIIDCLWLWKYHLFAKNLIAVNCWIAAALYAVALALSYWCMKHAQNKDRKAAEGLKDDEAFCRGKLHHT